MKKCNDMMFGVGMVCVCVEGRGAAAERRGGDSLLKISIDNWLMAKRWGGGKRVEQCTCVCTKNTHTYTRTSRNPPPVFREFRDI